MSRAITAPRLHYALAVLVCVVLPAASRLSGSGLFAWTMFSWGSSYRLRILGEDSTGVKRPIAPSALARFAGREVLPYLAGAEHFRHAPTDPVIESQLDAIARLACRAANVTRVEVTLDERVTPDRPTEERHGGAECRP